MKCEMSVYLEFTITVGNYFKCEKLLCFLLTICIQNILDLLCKLTNNHELNSYFNFMVANPVNLSDMIGYTVNNCLKS